MLSSVGGAGGAVRGLCTVLVVVVAGPGTCMTASLAVGMLLVSVQAALQAATAAGGEECEKQKQLNRLGHQGCRQPTHA